MLQCVLRVCVCVRAYVFADKCVRSYVRARTQGYFVRHKLPQMLQNYTSHYQLQPPLSALSSLGPLQKAFSLVMEARLAQYKAAATAQYVPERPE